MASKEHYAGTFQHWRSGGGGDQFYVMAYFGPGIFFFVKTDDTTDDDIRSGCTHAGRLEGVKKICVHYFYSSVFFLQTEFLNCRAEGLNNKLIIFYLWNDLNYWWRSGWEFKCKKCDSVFIKFFSVEFKVRNIIF